MVWTVAEITETLVCVGIPASMQAYKAWWVRMLTSLRGTQPQYINGYTTGSGPLGNYTIGGGEMPGARTGGTEGGQGQGTSRLSKRNRFTVEARPTDPRMRRSRPGRKTTLRQLLGRKQRIRPASTSAESTHDQEISKNESRRRAEEIGEAAYIHHN